MLVKTCRCFTNANHTLRSRFCSTESGSSNVMDCPKSLTCPLGGRTSLLTSSLSTSLFLLDFWVSWMIFFNTYVFGASFEIGHNLPKLTQRIGHQRDVVSQSKISRYKNCLVISKLHSKSFFCIHVPMSFSYLKSFTIDVSHDCCALTTVHLLHLFHSLFTDRLTSECATDAGALDRAKRFLEVDRREEILSVREQVVRCMLSKTIELLILSVVDQGAG